MLPLWDLIGMPLKASRVLLGGDAARDDRPEPGCTQALRHNDWIEEAWIYYRREGDDLDQ